MQLDLILPFFANMIEKELGIIYAEHNYFQLQNRLEGIAKLSGVSDIQELYESAQKGITPAFKQLLLDVATNNETSFFRDPRIYKALENVFLPTFWEASKGQKKLKIWSAASSTGQEALSVAMMIKEWNLKNGKNIDFSIIGTDISQRVLSIAKSAKYSQLEVQRGLPTPLLIKYFTKDSDDKWTAKPNLSHHTTFRTLNLKDQFAFAEPFDLVLCRNVLIYQNVEGKKDILNRIRSQMDANAFLVLGSGESLLGLSEDFEQKQSEGAVIYKKKYLIDAVKKAA